MTLKTVSSHAGVPPHPWPLAGPTCRCLAAFFREEFAKHHRCLQQQREYFSDNAIEQAEDILARVVAEIDQLCRREDAAEIVGQWLRQLDLVTNLSAQTEPRHLH